MRMLVAMGVMVGETGCVTYVRGSGMRMDDK